MRFYRRPFLRRIRGRKREDVVMYSLISLNWQMIPKNGKIVITNLSRDVKIDLDLGGWVAVLISCKQLRSSVAFSRGDVFWDQF